MTIDPVKIPQNVYVEDRIIGPVSLRQLMIVLLSGGLSYMIWTSIKQATGSVTVLSTILAWTPCALGVAFAFVKIQGISLLRFCLLIIEKTEKPSVRRFTPRKGVEINIRFSVKKEEDKVAPQTPHEKIDELSALLDRGPNTDRPVIVAQDATENVGTHRPVSKGRIEVSPRASVSGPVDDITSQPEEPATENRTGLMQDLLPPA